MIVLDHVKPIPIYSKPDVPESMIWDRRLVFEKGKKYWVRAPSGGGKSTLLHIIYGLRWDYEGGISLDGHSLNLLGVEGMSDIRKNKLTIVFQHLGLLSEVTAWENLQLANSLSEEVSEIRIREMASLLKVEDILEQSTGTLSYGQRQRIAIIRALAKPFAFLLLDEPFSHLDKENARAACCLIQEELERYRAGMILVSHDTSYDFDIDREFIL